MIKTMTKHLIYNMCINVFFDTVISNYIKPHIKSNRYAETANILGGEQYYRIVKFGELGKSEC